MKHGTYVMMQFFFPRETELLQAVKADVFDKHLNAAIKLCWAQVSAVILLYSSYQPGMYFRVNFEYFSWDKL